MSKVERKYKFDWNSITANLETARPQLGPNARVEAYRIFQFTLRDVLEQNYGVEQTDDLFRQAGALSGKYFFQIFCVGVTDISSLIQTVRTCFKDFGVGIFRAEVADMEQGFFRFTVSEDIGCSGMPDTGDETCVYSEGFIAGVLDAFTGKTFAVKEIDCWSTGDRTCRFEAKVKQ